MIRIQWQQYDHVTCLTFGFVADKYTPAGSPDPVSTTLKFIRRLKDDPEFLRRTQEIFEWDNSSGSCSGSHYRSPNTLRAKSLPEGFDVLKSVKWHLRTGATHTILTGEVVDGTLYLIDTGINYQTIRIRPSNSFAIEKAAIGSATELGGEDYHMWKIRRTALVGDWEILYRVRSYFPLRLTFSARTAAKVGQKWNLHRSTMFSRRYQWKGDGIDETMNVREFDLGARFAPSAMTESTKDSTLRHVQNPPGSSRRPGGWWPS